MWNGSWILVAGSIFSIVLSIKFFRFLSVSMTGYRCTQATNVLFQNHDNKTKESQRPVFKSRIGADYRLSSAKVLSYRQKRRSNRHFICRSVSIRKIKDRKLSQIDGIIISQIAALGPILQCIARICNRKMFHYLKSRLYPYEPVLYK